MEPNRHLTMSSRGGGTDHQAERIGKLVDNTNYANSGGTLPHLKRQLLRHGCLRDVLGGEEVDGGAGRYTGSKGVFGDLYITSSPSRAAARLSILGK